MRKYILFALIMKISVCINLQAQTELPAKAMFRPKYLLERNDTRAEWDSKIKNENWGNSSNRFWDVYSDRADNFTFSTSSGITRFKQLDFMEKVKIAKISNGYALIYKEEYAQSFPDISKSAISLGWISIDHLLLWNSCPIDKHKIYDKGVVVNNLDELSSDDGVNTRPSFKENPELTKSTGLEALKLEFYFIYKEEGESFLIGKQNQIEGSNSEKAVILGWISKKSITRWNQRICLEPVYGQNNLAKLSGSIKPAIFLEKNQAIAYQTNGSMENAYVRPPLELNRMLPYTFRYPILSTPQEDVHNVVTIGNMSESTIKPTAETFEKYNYLKKLQANINVVFVIDGTSSMTKYYKPIAEALIKSTKKDDISSRFKFGAVIYRDYIDKNEAIETKPLTSIDKINEITSFLMQVEAKSHAGDDLPEALFYGLETALDKNMGFQKDESNFIILVGDAGNHLDDAEGRTLDKITNKLAEYSVNLIAFQANNGYDATYTDFITQSMSMIKQTIKSAVGSSVDFKLTKPGYKESVVKGSNEKTIMVGGIAFCDIGKSQQPEQLEKLVETKITDFDEQVKSWLSLLEKMVNSRGSDVWTDEIIQWMKRKGFTDAQIKILQGEQIKVNGYTSSKIKKPELNVFDYTIFISKVEFDELIENLNIVYKPISSNRRRDFQDALKSLALSYVGQSDIENYEVDEIMKDILGGVPYVSNSLKGIKIRDIIEIKRLSNQELDRYMSNFKQSITHLESITNNRDYYFESNGQRYYWIPVDEMP